MKFTILSEIYKGNIMRNNRRRKRMSESFLPADIGIGILFTLFFISLGLILAINLRFLYYADIKWFDLENTTGLSYSTIKLNYDALIDYCWPFFTGKLVFPTLAASASGLSHFEEVKVLFNAFYIIFGITLISLAGIIIWKYKKRQFQYLRVASITAIVLPLVTLLGCSINFNAAFTLMHKIFFRNDDWLFDPATDPIITLLPEEFFLQCAIVIIAVVLIGCLTLYLVYRKLKKKSKVQPLIQPKVNYYY